MTAADLLARARRLEAAASAAEDAGDYSLAESRRRRASIDRRLASAVVTMGQRAIGGAP